MQKTLPAQIPVVRWTCKVAERFAKNFLHAHKRCFDKNTKVQQTHLKSRCKTISLHHIQSLAKINDQISHALPLSLKTWHHHRMLSWARSITWEHIFPYPLLPWFHAEKPTSSHALYCLVHTCCNLSMQICIHPRHLQSSRENPHTKSSLLIWKQMHTYWLLGMSPSLSYMNSEHLATQDPSYPRACHSWKSIL